MQAKDRIMSHVLEKKNSDIQRRDSVSSQQQKAREDMIKQVVMMGFDMDVVEYAELHVENLTVQGLLDYLTKDDRGYYGHDFVETHGMVCYLCKEDASHHLNFKEIRLVEIQPIPTPDLNLMKQKSHNLAEKLKSEIHYLDSDQICPICCEPKTQYLELDCKDQHKFCTDCTIQYLKTNINDGKVLDIKCMDASCQIYIKEQVILDLLQSEQELLEKYKRFVFRRKIEKDPLIRWCSRPTCEKYVKAKSIKDKKLKCECGQLVCFQCGNEYHGSSKCDSVIDKQFFDWVNENNVRYCPSCKIRIEKNDGCNHMTCIYCRFEFCWICGGMYAPDHFNPLNPIGCTGTFNLRPGFFNQLTVFLKRLIKGIFMLILLPFFVIFITPLFMAGLFVDKCFRQRISPYQGCKRKVALILVGILGFLLGLVLNVLTIPLIVIALPCFLVFSIVNICRRYRQSRLLVQQRLREMNRDQAIAV
ncbi:ibr domain containing protein [Stylonychia lemnae]|uniref:RBR-type E3 ubiquitin transferase n=1 Tax=Stylonychia lemnae TaxID=5949 RepID=A0A078AVD6_STYLE|nr:ibr domain containing protein [Stylonychia lemnae]|eukprot:CDW86144.1 ibr domain containing protein [Stylonychia lemnae]